ncbi:unnamed protein product [Rotaria magnacalcarata]
MEKQLDTKSQYPLSAQHSALHSVKNKTDIQKQDMPDQPDDDYPSYSTTTTSQYPTTTSSTQPGSTKNMNKQLTVTRIQK